MAYASLVSTNCRASIPYRNLVFDELVQKEEIVCLTSSAFRILQKILESFIKIVPSDHHIEVRL